MMFVFGALSVNANVNIEDRDCFNEAINNLEAFQDMGSLHDMVDAANYLNDFYAACNGEKKD